MKHSILVIVDSQLSLDQADALESPHIIDVVVGVENAIEQLYQLPYDAILYEGFTDSVEEKKLLKIISLEQTPPTCLKKDPASTWEQSLQQLIRSIPPSVQIIDGTFENDLFNICLN